MTSQPSFSAAKHDTAQNRVETGAIATAGENADPWLSSAEVHYSNFFGSTSRPPAAH